MSEQPIDYGKEMFKHVDPKAVIGGVKQSIMAWWHEFSPGTIGKEGTEAFDRVASRVKNEPLKKFLQDRKDVVRPLAIANGVNMLVLDGVLATVPLYLKWQGRIAGEEMYRQRVSQGAADRVLTNEAARNYLSPEGRRNRSVLASDRFHNLTGLRWLWDKAGGSPEHRYNADFAEHRTRLWARNRALNKLTEEHKDGARYLNALGEERKFHH